MSNPQDKAANPAPARPEEDRSVSPQNDGPATKRHKDPENNLSTGVDTGAIQPGRTGDARPL
jgi:hypothetical protein